MVVKKIYSLFIFSLVIFMSHNALALKSCVCSANCPGYSKQKFNKKGKPVDTNGHVIKKPNNVTVSKAWCYYDAIATRGECDTPPGPKLKKIYQSQIRGIKQLNIEAAADDGKLEFPLAADDINAELSKQEQIDLPLDSFTIRITDSKGKITDSITNLGTYKATVVFNVAQKADTPVTATLTVNVKQSDSGE